MMYGIRGAITHVFAWDNKAPLARCKGETRRANDALRDYWLMGPGRSLNKLREQYCGQTDGDSRVENPPTRRKGTLEHWSVKYRWQARIDRSKEIFDDEIAQQEFEARRADILGSGYSLYFERVADLKALAELLHDELRDEKKRWLPDVKQIGSGEKAERVDIVRFNAPLIEQYRRTLDDIAAELSQRVKQLNLQGGIGITSVSSDEMAQARDKAQAFEEELLGDDE